MLRLSALKPKGSKLIAAVAAAGIALMATGVTAAQADGWHHGGNDWHGGGWHRGGGWHGGWNSTVIIGPGYPGYYYAPPPPPVYYAPPPPVYYVPAPPPPPVYYAPAPAVSLQFRL